MTQLTEMPEVIEPTEAFARRAWPLTYPVAVVALLVFMLIAETLCWAAGARWGASKAIMSNIFVVISTSVIVAVLVLAWLPLKGQAHLDRAQRSEKTAFSWLAILAVVHLTWEMPWVIFHRWIMGSAGAGKLWSYLWWIYADGGDNRYIHPPPDLLAMETGASILGLTALVLLLLRIRAKRFTGGILVGVLVLMTCEFFSTVIYILSECYAHFANVTGGSANFVIKFVYGNILWLIVPVIVFLWAARLLISLREAGAT